MGIFQSTQLQYGKAVEQSNRPKHAVNQSLLEFAKACDKIFLDESREAFISRQEILLDELQAGMLVGRNRFRELLLGSNAAGKTAMLNILHTYITETYSDQNVISVFIRYDRTEKKPSELICSSLQKAGILTKYEVAQIRDCPEINDKYEFIKNCLKEKSKFLVLLVDEFQLVYKLDNGVGKTIVQEVATISDSTSGRINLVVTGSSSELRKLAFAKLKDADKSHYPSYIGQDLNSTKLCPHWIFPITRANEFLQLVNTVYHPKTFPSNEIVPVFIRSGGHPGLIKEESVAYSVSTKYFETDNDLRSKILTTLVHWTSAFSNIKKTNNDNEEENEVDDICELERLCSLFSPISVEELKKILKENKEVFDPTQFMDALYDLADEGAIVFSETNKFEQEIAIAGPYLYFQWDTIRRTNESDSLKAPSKI